MQFDHSFAVAANIDETWRLLLDTERSAPCLPGATIEAVDGDRVTGSVKVKLGPLNLLYVGTATVTERDEAARRLVLDVEGVDARTDSTATLHATLTLSDTDGRTNVAVRSELELTGKPAQFSHRVLDEVGAKMAAQFADALGHVLDGTAPPAKKTAKKAAKKVAKKTAKKAAKKSAAKSTAASAARKTAATGTSAAKPAAAKKTASASTRESAPANATRTAPSFAAPGGIPPAPTLEDAPSINGHSGVGTGNSAAQQPSTVRSVQAAVPAAVRRAVPIVGSVAVGLVIVLVVQQRRRAQR